MNAYHNLLKETLLDGGFAYTVEIVTPEAVKEFEPAIASILELARYVKEEPRVSAVAVTDRVKSDHDHDPVAVAHRVAEACGKEPLVHLAGKDRTPRDLEQNLERMERFGLHNPLLVTGDRLKAPPSDRPVRYLDSVNAIWETKRRSKEFLAAAAVCPFKYREEELWSQYLKLAKKLRAGADLIISQIGFDMEKAQGLISFVRSRGYSVPVMAGVLFLTAPRGRYVRKVGLPGITITDDLQAKLEEEAKAPEQVHSASCRRLALQIVGLRRMGYAGAHVSGLHTPQRGEIERLLNLVDRLDEEFPTLEEWWEGWRRSLTMEDGRVVRTAPVIPAGEAGADPSAVEYARFKALDTIDRLVFQGGSPGAKLLGPLIEGAENHPKLERLLLRAERMAKEPIVGCQSCGFCRLPYTAYVCPESCPKGLANGPCGGTRENLCESGDRECVYGLSYRLSKAAGRLDDLEELLIPPVPESSRGRCSWLNHFNGRGPEVIRMRGRVLQAR
jgi:methylenetetrahydrofolate reductase (NADPH)